MGYQEVSGLLRRQRDFNRFLGLGLYGSFPLLAAVAHGKLCKWPIIADARLVVRGGLRLMLTVLGDVQVIEEVDSSQSPDASIRA